MSFAKISSGQPFVLSAHIISIEIDIAKGLHAFNMVGLPDKAVEEARDRVCSAIKNSGFKSPKQKNEKIIVSLAPADLRKEGPAFDVPIALAYLKASGDIRTHSAKQLFMGELSLNGEVRAVKGVLPVIREAVKQGFSEVFIPYDNSAEASLIDSIVIYPAKTLREIIDHIDETPRETTCVKLSALVPTQHIPISHFSDTDMADIHGQETAKRGLEIAAAGRHNIALFGPPGTGKTMLAKAFRSILPMLSFEETLDVSSIHSVSGISYGTHGQPPFRAPHHTSSYVSIIGGGAFPKPGEITLAHKGVLFLDEFPEFERRVIDSLRQPLEERTVSVSRAKGTALFPADFILIAAMNPCPCGFYGSKEKECICSQPQKLSYQRKISGPIIDRIDMWIEVAEINRRLLSVTPPIENKNSSAHMRERITKAHNLQNTRFQSLNLPHIKNATIPGKLVFKIAGMSKETEELLIISAEKLKLSARGYHRVIRLARTIADIEGSKNVEKEHILEALHYRPKMN